jgi:transcriptional regulator with GAF, ATPase, and Fis domain
VPRPVTNIDDVILWDPNTDRRQTVISLIDSLGATTCEISTGSLDSIEREFSHNVALVALGNSSSQQENSLAFMRALKRKGVKVIAYENGLLSWPIGIRCRALLNGSFLLLDSSANSFNAELREALSNIRKSETESQLKEERIKEQMKALGIVGVSRKMISVFRWVARVSNLSDFPVLICGETGTGKELIANAIHKLDPKRRKGPFIAANCSAINSELAESELFGHRRGAFTGAENNRLGLFRAAEGGVLFLDEVSELNESLQAKLLRVLQERRVLGVGFDQEIAIDVRVIAATNRSLEEMIEQGKFREDLYHRLNVLSVTIPPLRDRYEDLSPLIEHFLSKYQSLNQCRQAKVSRDFIEALSHVRLSGNARQLENFVRLALLNKTESDAMLSLSDLTPAVWQDLSDEIELRPTGNGSPTPQAQFPKQATEADPQSYFQNILDLNGWNLTKSLESCEKSLLQCALQFTQGNQSQTARMMGITPRSVYNKVQKYKLTSHNRQR